MNTVYGILFDRDGLASKHTLARGAGGPVLRRQSWATPAADVCAAQDPKIIVDQEHDHRAVGEVVYLERASSGDVWCVAHVDPAVIPVVLVGVGGETVMLERSLYWSAERIGGPESGYLLTAASLTTLPARVSAKPVEFLPGALDYRQAVDRWTLNSFQKQLLTRAANSHLDRWHRGDREEPLIVHEPALDAQRHGPSFAQRERDQQQRELATGALRHGGAGSILRIR